MAQEGSHRRQRHRGQGVRTATAVAAAATHSTDLFGIERLHHQSVFFIVDNDLFGLVLCNIASQAVLNIIFSVGTERKTVVMGFIAIMAGKFGGSLQTGRYLQWASGAETNNNKLYAWIMTQMGYPMSVFGSTNFGSGFLPGL